MQLTIFDVAHGFCSYIVADTRNVILVDCGHDIDRGFTPSTYLYGETNCTGIEKLVVCNYDEDHIADLPNLFKRPISTLLRNTSVDHGELRAIKEKTGPVSDAMETLLFMIEFYTGPVRPPIDYGAIERSVFYNRYPDFQDTNNLSLVMFLHYRDLSVAFTGDLEKAGWLKLLEQSAFRRELERVNVFIASHHGRESGYCSDVFSLCQPEVVIISDAEHEDDALVETYAKHASGISWKGGRAKVLSTWEWGHLVLEQDETGGPAIHAIVTG